MDYKKKLIEVALPLEEINKASAREKSIRHGHPSTLHLWWARRPLAAARAVIWASLVDDPSAHPEEFPTEEAQNAERERLFNILRELVVWENSNNITVLDAAKAEILKSTDGNPPPLLDPFAGGGAIPLEAQRLGLKAYASDLNPVAVMINKAMIEIPPKFAGQPPVNPESKKLFRTWEGAQGLAEDVRYYGEWMKQKAFEKIGHLYPNVKDEYGKEHTVIAWIWARTVRCPNPACGCEMPLATTFELSTKKGKETYSQPIFKGKEIEFEVRFGSRAPAPPRTGRGKFQCIRCNSPVELDYIRDESKASRMGVQLLAVVAEGNNQRLYLSPDNAQIQASNLEKPDGYPSGYLTGKAKVNVGVYGLKETSDLFTNRQLNTLNTFSDLVEQVREQVEIDGGNKDYAQAIVVYLAFAIDKMTDINSSVSSWINANGVIRNTFARQAIPMVWDFAESNPFSNSTGSYKLILEKITECITELPCNKVSSVSQFDAQTDNGLRNVMVSTDPPYYDNIAYADLSDYFYVWLRKALKVSYPSVFKTMLVPKAEELVATPYRFDGGIEEAQAFFENGMLKTFKLVNVYARNDIPVTVYYAYKQSEEDEDDKKASTGWETMLTAIIQAGFTITGTWPMRTERAGRILDIGMNALASSIVLVCRKRPQDAPICTRRDFVNTLKRELKPALQKLQAANIAPVDLAQSAIGPGMGVYSRYSQVLEADGSPMSVRSALQIINQELDAYFNEQDGELDGESRFCIDLYTQNAFNNISYGEADVLARAKITSVDRLVRRGMLFAEKGVVRLLTREELPVGAWANLNSTWMLTQQLTHAMETGGIQACAQITASMPGDLVERAKALTYRLFTIADRKGWTKEAFAYNSLITTWQDVQTAATQQRGNLNQEQQGKLFS